MTPLLRLFFLPLLLSACSIDWNACGKATCFSKYPKEDRLGLYIKTTSQSDPSVGLFLQNGDGVPDVTRVGIRVEVSGMQDEDYAVIAVGNNILAGCRKNSQQKLATVKSDYMKQKGEQSYANNVFCCMVNLENLNVEYLAVQSSLPLAVVYSSGGKNVTLPTDFTSSIIFSGMKHREKVTCDISSFRMENPLVGGPRLYYPFQDLSRARCDLVNYGIMKTNGSASVPQCKNGKWTVEGKEVDSSAMPFRCEPYHKQLRRSCSGYAPPAEILCGSKCGSLHDRFFECGKGTKMHVLDGSLKWNKVDKIVCTEHGYVSMNNNVLKRLPIDAKVQCKVREEDMSSTFFLSYPRWLPFLIGLAIFVLFSGGILKGCLVLFNKWEAKVQQIGPVKSGNGPSASGRTTRNNSTMKDESNKNTPSNRTVHSGKSMKH